jgi:iron complex transport system substrate-binding protein
VAANPPLRSARALFGALAIAIAGCAPGASQSSAPTGAPPTTPPTVAAPSPTAQPAFPITLTDDEGTEVTIPAAPQRIVSLTPATTETLFALGVGDRVVAKVEDIAEFPPEAASVPIVATFAGVDVEKIVALEADLVVSGGAGLTQGPAVEQLRRANIPVVVSYPTSVDAGLEGIKLIGRAVGKGPEGKSLADAIRTRLDDLAAVASRAATKPRVFYEIDITNGIFTPPAASIYGEMFRLAGAEPISGDTNYSISLEELVAADPEVILLGDAGYGQSPKTVKARQGWAGMTAVKNGRIVPIDDIVVTRPGPRIAEGLYALIVAIHPETESDLPLPYVTLGPIPPTTLAGLPKAA